MKIVSLFLSAVTITALMTGCNTFKKSGITATNNKTTVTTTPVTPTPAPEAPSATDSFMGQWSIVEINGEAVSVNGENHPKITFEAVPDVPGTMLLIGYNGCNYLNGNVKVEGDKLIAQGEFISTLRACPDAPYESAVNAALNEMTGYRFDGASMLVLTSATGRDLMKLRKHNLSFLNGAWKVLTIKGQAVPASADVKVVIDTDERKIHGNAGCNMLNGEIVVNLDKGSGIEFKNLATTRMTCPDIATEQAFLLALEEVDTAVQGTDANEAVMKDSDGKVIMTLKRISSEELADD